MTNKYPMGTLVELAVAFTDTSMPPVPTDPTAIILTITKPDNTSQTINYPASGFFRDGVGAYHYNFDTSVVGTLPGTYIYNFQGTGALVAANNAQFYLTPSPSQSCGC